ncbi:MAG: phosphomannomutase/phosphoglucomutase [Candidatus Moranbacteria bacterium]|nr:phosphomannomutase/phosphoglucomutase [Candidatus Moranbacteria bacterium]MBP7695719.1 phosphomannomutase/phosphoglucomutase [Candidatus Moranbacteria bacterium]
MDTKIFKAYDIRGIYGTDFDETDAYAIGRAAVDYLECKRIAVGRDARASSPVLFESFTRGAMEAGCDVLDLGVITTPMVYFAAGRLDVDAAVSITASHNPPEYNGMKICLRGAIPVGEATGLASIRDLAVAGEWKTSEQKGSLTPEDIKPAYYGYFSSFAAFGDRRFSIVIDTANAMGVLELPIYEQLADHLDITRLYDDLAHPFSAHEANPLKIETLDELRAQVIARSADLGIAYDGDADRIGFVDETGLPIPMDLVTALLAKEVLKQKPGATILYDLRSSRSVKEFIKENGGQALECRVGHAFIKQQMRETGAVFAGELSGHYYFEENSVAEAGTLPALLLLNLMTETGQPISALVAETKRYFHSGEINSEVHDKDAVLERLRERYADGTQHELDGLKVDYPDWWFNVRPSNTEPLLRLNLEAATPELMEAKRDELLALIRS